MSGLLVIRGGAVGDFVLTLPVLAALRRYFPRQRLEILGYPSIASLAVAGGMADKVAPVESPRFTGLFAVDGSWPVEITAWLGGMDRIISFLHDPHGIFRANVARCTHAPFLVGPHRPDETSPAHATMQLLEPLQAWGIHSANPRPILVLPTLSTSFSGFLAVHPGSGSERKNWPEARWTELLKRVASESSRNVLLIGGEAEGDRCERLAALLPAGRVEMAQNLPLVELARHLQNCSSFVGHDSGITHLAAALDLPGLVLWGETSLTTWRPQSDQLRTLRCSAGLKRLPVAAVWQELKGFL